MPNGAFMNIFHCSKKMFLEVVDMIHNIMSVGYEMAHSIIIF